MSDTVVGTEESVVYETNMVFLPFMGLIIQEMKGKTVKNVGKS